MVKNVVHFRQVLTNIDDMYMRSVLVVSPIQSSMFTPVPDHKVSQ